MFLNWCQETFAEAGRWCVAWFFLSAAVQALCRVPFDTSIMVAIGGMFVLDSLAFRAPSRFIHLGTTLAIPVPLLKSLPWVVAWSLVTEVGIRLALLWGPLDEYWSSLLVAGCLMLLVQPATAIIRRRPIGTGRTERAGE